MASGAKACLIIDKVGRAQVIDTSWSYEYY